MSVSITSDGVSISSTLHDKMVEELNANLLQILKKGFFCQVFIKEKKEKNNYKFKKVGVQIIVKDSEKNGIFIKANKVNSNLYSAFKKTMNVCLALAKKFKKRSREVCYFDVKENDLFNISENEELKLKNSDIVEGKADIVIMNDQNTFNAMGIEEAIEKFELLSMDLLMFINIDTKKSNLIYRRADMNIGWIDMEEKVNSMINKDD